MFKHIRTIHLGEVLSSIGDRFCGTQSRKASATAVQFISKTHILVAELLDKRLLLVSVDSGEITQEVATPEFIDLMWYCKGTKKLYTGNAKVLGQPGSYSIFDIGPKLDHRVSRILPNFDIHSAKLNPQGNIILCSTNLSAGGFCGLAEETPEGIVELSQFSTYFQGNQRPKDLAFSGRGFFITTSDGRVGLKPTETNAVIHLRYLNSDDGSCQGHISMSGHGDSLSLVGDKILVVDQIHHKVYVVKWKRVGDTVDFQIIGEHTEALFFPHGIDYEEESDTLAVTNYGDNSVALFSGVKDL